MAGLLAKIRKRGPALAAILRVGKPALNLCARSGHKRQAVSNRFPRPRPEIKLCPLAQFQDWQPQASSNSRTPYPGALGVRSPRSERQRRSGLVVEWPGGRRPPANGERRTARLAAFLLSLRVHRSSLIALAIVPLLAQHSAFIVHRSPRRFSFPPCLVGVMQRALPAFARHPSTWTLDHQTTRSPPPPCVPILTFDICTLPFDLLPPERKRRRQSAAQCLMSHLRLRHFDL